MKRVLLLSLALSVQLGPARAQANWDQGTVAVAHELLKLGTSARVLHVAAHPDDEDSALLAYLARGLGARTVYLSLTRGEGGQNGIGGELGPGIGVLRTAELLAARQLDGAEQIFGDCADFGFSKSAAETLTKWDEQRALGKLVLALRRYRPQVVIMRFNGDPRDGHGHHQASALLCRRAFRAAADPHAYPEQLAAGLQPFQANKLYVDWRLPDATCVVPVGDWLPLYGRSPFEIAMAGRSRHRSQDMGALELHGEVQATLKLLDSDGGPFEASAPLFAGLDVSTPGIVPDPGAGGPAWQRTVHQLLAQADDSAQTAAATYQLGRYPTLAMPHLAQAVRGFRRAVELLEESHPPRDSRVATWQLALAQKLAEAQRALALGVGVQVDALATAPYAVPGGTVTLTAQACFPRLAQPTAVRLRLDAPPGWQVAELEPAPPPTSPFGALPVADLSQRYQLTVPADEPVSPASGADGRPFPPPRLTVTFQAQMMGAAFDVTVPVQYRWLDPRFGERRRELQVVPAVTAAVRPAVLVRRPGAPPPLVTLTLTNHTGRQLTDGLLELPPGTSRHQVPPARVAWQRRPLSTLHDLAYEHIAPRFWCSPATVVEVDCDVAVAPGLRVGWVPSPEDETSEALVQLGLEPRLLTAEALARGDFAGLDTIVVASRAYETNPALLPANARLLDWARAGGTLVVLYQKYPFATAQAAPYPLTFATPHDRVTDEEAPVTLTLPEHPLLTRPNRLGPADFAGWVQERGLYFAHTWASEYQTPLSCHDPGEAPQAGGLLAAPLGRGRYVYCAYSLFRQLPAGVPGAYRLLANLVSWGR